MKKLLIFLVLFNSHVFAQTTSVAVSEIPVEIRSIAYTIDGKTKKYALQLLTAELQEGLVFPRRDVFETLANDVYIRLQGVRTVQEAAIDYTYETLPEKEFIDINIRIKDTLNILVLPYPKWDDNEGLTLSLRVRDYNFLGTQSTAEIDADYLYLLDKGHGFRTKFFMQPSFSFGPENQLRSIVLFELRYTETEDVTLRNQLGLGISFLLYDQPWEMRIIQETEVPQLPLRTTSDDYFGTTRLELGGPINTQLRIPLLGFLYYDMLVHANFVYDYSGKDAGRVRYSTAYYRHGFRVSRFTQVANFVKGMRFTIRHTSEIVPTNTKDKMRNTLFFEGVFSYPFFNRMAIKGRANIIALFHYTRSDFGIYYRGVLNDAISNRDLHASLNFEIVAHLFTVFKTIEAHGSIFTDMGISMDRESPFTVEDDFFLTTGIEGFLYFNRRRSFIVRLSLGIDPFALTENLKISKPGDAFWDSKELFFGIGLHF